MCAVYAGTSQQTAYAEVASYVPLNGKVLVTKDFVVNNVLDLTDPTARQALGVTLDQITQSSHGGAAYDATQAISNWARDQGYQAILAPSAQNRSGVNLISFKSLGKN
ncbi:MULTISPECIES: RES family NAD+ phosphorylase [unclassified Burkholderia]|uniref:RES family NAD+ phosphorylase n=1 Tax=unclassified Burkholderia TaxID=2613784 RepID=UPI001423F3BA|nr:MULTISPECIES: RES family NAD+ phosphorylase [unclassified Burkholderia]NIE58189.1 RES family NAD+ phosphorylase [Burkholderia sp. Ap-955]NIF13040.1 RES family NAD+ phosphorylase [Burkholderia sp. Ax-1735]NIG05836.1 RES family NAD+ phosphorylase [Burkholderia sp. Tr-849]